MATPKKTANKAPAAKAGMDWLSFIGGALQVGGAIALRIIDEKRKGTTNTLDRIEALVPGEEARIKQMRAVQKDELDKARELLGE